MNKSNTKHGVDYSDRLIWLDCETTGLDSSVDKLLQVAVVVTDTELNLIHAGLEVTIHQRQHGWHVRSLMDSVVTKMHTDSGLLAKVFHPENAMNTANAEDEIVSYLDQYAMPGSSPMCGNNVGFDRGFIKQYMPDLHDFFHYRNIDVSTVKELARRWHPPVYDRAPTKQLKHTALADIMESIAELWHYKRHFMNKC